MTLKERINEDLKTAFKSGSSDVVSTLRFLSSVIKNKELEKRTKMSKEGGLAKELEKLSELTEEELIGVILGEIKKRKESVVQYEKGGRADLAEKETKELEIIKKYAPEEMPEDELRAIIKGKIGEIGGATMKDFGRLMSLIMAEVKGRAGGDIVKKIIEEELK
ncbi:MAG: GatB/YqeY domain-containing protein [Parcubacteria group bacterium]|nr:GatB/YqeY domain-containing protein [Parcubacteria group bacterium]